jgi:hypothetical protein
MRGVGLRDPLADFVFALVLRPPVLDPLLGDSTVGTIEGQKDKWSPRYLYNRHHRAN